MTSLVKGNFLLLQNLKKFFNPIMRRLKNEEKRETKIGKSPGRRSRKRRGKKKKHQRVTTQLEEERKDREKEDQEGILETDKKSVKFSGEGKEEDDGHPYSTTLGPNPEGENGGGERRKGYPGRSDKEKRRGRYDGFHD